MSGSAGGNKERARKKGGKMEGRILKIKTGYNPNSSSIGVDVIAFFTAGAAMTVLFNTVAAVLIAAKMHKHGRPEELQEMPVPGQGEDQA
jgi:hypothetical protein